MELCDLDSLLIRSSILSICAAHHYVLDSSLRASSPLRAGSYIFICSSYLTINLSNLFSVVDPWYPIAIDEWAICLLPHLSRGRRAHGITTSYFSPFDRIDGGHVCSMFMHLLPTQHMFRVHASLYSPSTRRLQCPYIPCTYLLYSLWLFMSII
jgi:hypothetical protein